ncbi:UDP-glucuronosyltransferase 2A1-like [Elysia marginata]|uniref:UDP-glucuronosyltransferase 2A1-like n=1 Tax=Elysia marginata TaxID=1093978 RepID=A0AAV4JXZ8_9GAST|nr:UDP-glucuronosyltransferase 2A1-like [Elysia marginata]
MITEDVATLKEIQIRIEKTRQTFWENKELLRRNVGLNTKKRILACYIFSVFNYGCEAWSGPIPRRFNRTYRRSKCGATGDFSRSHGQKRKPTKKLYKWLMSAKDCCNNL